MGIRGARASIAAWRAEIRIGTMHTRMIAGETYPSVDHVLPIAKGGKHEWSNVQLLCRHCNSIKGDRQSPPKRVFASSVVKLWPAPFCAQTEKLRFFKDFRLRF